MTARLTTNRMPVPPPSMVGNRRASAGGLAARDDHVRDAPTRVAGWGALGAMSVSLLVVALVVGERLGAVLAATGLAGLAVFRIAATYGGWVHRGSILAESASWPDNSARDPGGASGNAGGGR